MKHEKEKLTPFLLELETSCQNLDAGLNSVLHSILLNPTFWTCCNVHGLKGPVSTLGLSPTTTKRCSK